MRILTRYLLAELLAIFFVTLAGMTFVLLPVMVIREAIDNGFGLGPIIRMLPYALPEAMRYAVPGAMLLSATSVFGRVAAANEIIAVKALGISPWTLVWPALVFAAFVSLATVLLNDIAVSWGRAGVARVALESFEEIVYGRLRTKGSFSRERLRINARGVDGKQILGPIIQFRSGQGQPWTVITARQAQLAADLPRRAVVVRLLDTEGDGLAGWSVNLPGEFERWFALEDFTGQKRHGKSTSDYALREIGPSAAKQVAVIDRIEQEMAADAGFAMLTGDYQRLSDQQWLRHANRLVGAKRTLDRLYTEPHRRWANGFSCLCFALVGAPMAIRRRQGEFWGSFFACFLPILLVYYPMLVGCVDQAKGGTFPPQAVWLGNLVLALWGAWLMRRVIRF